MKKMFFALCACSLIAAAALAMGAAPKPAAKPGLQVLKMEIVSPLATFEGMSSKKALIVTTGYYKELKQALEAQGFKVTVTAKVDHTKATDYDAIVVVGEKLEAAALKGLKR